MDIWAECRHRVVVEPIADELVRVVECQEQIATNHLVDNLQQQDLLEQMLEQTKPPMPAHTDSLHYLLSTPFRYPPLKYGSRFGSRFEPSLFYGSHSVFTGFAETAYYRLLFWYGMLEPPAARQFVTQHTVFGVRYKTPRGLKLQQPPCNAYESQLSDPASYASSQPLGQAMRAFGIQAFEFVSARDPHRGINAALFSAEAFDCSQPLFQQQWLCETIAEAVSFYSAMDEKIYQYPLDNFLLEGELPMPAF